MRTLIALSVALAGLLPAAADAGSAAEAAVQPVQAGTLRVAFRAAVAVKSHSVLLGDVAELAGLDEARLKELGSLRLSHAPLAGAQRVVNAEEIRRRLKGAGVREPVEFADGGKACTVSLAVRPVTGDELVRCGRALLEERAARPGAEVRIEDPETPRAVVVADAGVELKAETQVHRLAGLVPVTVEVWSGGERAARVMLSYRVKARAMAVQASRNLDSGSIIAEGDLQDVEADMSELPDDAVTSRASLIGQRVLRPLSAGTWIPRAAVAQPLQVRRGAPVTLLARIGTVEARASAQAKQDGSSGEIISVVNLSSKRTLRARVAGEGLVEAVLQ